LDTIAGVWVAFFILKQGVMIIREIIQTLMVASPGLAFESEIKAFVAGLDGVRRVVWLKGRILGSGNFIDVAVTVDGNVSVQHGHEIATDIQQAVKNRFSDVLDTLVHIEPDI